MPEFDKNAAYIWACYGLASLLILGLTLHVVLAARSARKRLEAHGPGSAGEA
jgi:heme exporter protein CcmD